MKPFDVVDKEKAPITIQPHNTASPTTRFSRGMVIGIITLIVFIQLGFFNSYIKYFPRFASTTGPFGPVEFNWVMHVHGMIMMAWVIMLLVQPILMRKGKTELHRRVGRLSYVLAPLVVLSIYMANYDGYHRALPTLGEKQAVAFLSLTFPGLVYYAVLYSLAMYNINKPALHMRFMCSTAFLFIPPALDRTLIFFFQLPGYDVGSFIQLAIIAGVVVFDSIKTKRVSPFLLVFIFELLHVTFWNLKFTPFWQAIGGAISKLF